MHSLLVASVILSVVGVSVSPSGAAAQPDILWQKAVDLAAASQGWKPGRTVARTENLAKDGRAKSVEEVTLAYPPTDEGAPELVRFLRDGVDVTEQERATFLRKRQAQEKKRESGSKPNRISMGISGSPFDPEAQATVHVRRTSEKRTIGGRACQAFEYDRPNPQGGRQVGTALLDEQTGAPVSLVERPEPLPRFADRVSLSMVFEQKGPSEWYPTRVSIEAAGGLLFVRKNIRATIELLDYRRTPTRP